MANKDSIKKREIQIQKPAQSLTAFQHKVASGADDRANLMKRIVIAAAALLLLVAGFAIGRIWRGYSISRHEIALSALVAEVEGSPLAPAPPEEKEQRLRNALPKMEELARKAPRACRDVANGLVVAWKLELDGKGGEMPAPKDPWSRIRLAQRSIALGRAKEASDLISPLRDDAKPNRAWSQLYWSALMQVRQLEGNREQALKDYSDYRKMFKTHADLATMDKLLNSI
jgi:hypothetical protein